MFNVGIGEIFAILVVCLVLFGPERLPELARQAGRLLGQFQLLVQVPSTSSRRTPTSRT
jgi:sec-independent protein translocase protein TatB